MIRRSVPIVVGLVVATVIGFNNQAFAGDRSNADTVEQPGLEGGAQPAYRSMSRVPGGTFLQDDVYGGSFAHTIRDFDIGQYEVTYELWYTVHAWADENGYVFENAGTQGTGDDSGVEPGECRHEPVTEVSWYDIVVWANAYSEMAGLDPVYYLDSEHTELVTDATAQPDLRKDWVDWDADGYRLPTEGEWQYAASRRGDDNTDEGVLEYPEDSGQYWTPSDWPSGAEDAWRGDNENNEEVAWIYANRTGQTQPVGEKKANQLGVHDMSGNVWEWTWDWRADEYPKTEKTDYHGPDNGSDRVTRGGGWNIRVHGAQVGMRNSVSPSAANSMGGFRVVRTP